MSHIEKSRTEFRGRGIPSLAIRSAVQRNIDFSNYFTLICSLKLFYSENQSSSKTAFDQINGVGIKNQVYDPSLDNDNKVQIDEA